MECGRVQIKWNNTLRFSDKMTNRNDINIGDCFIRPPMGGRSRSIWRVVSIEGNECRADLYDFGEQGIYCYRSEPFSLRRVSTLIPVPKEHFERVEKYYDNALASARNILASAQKWKSEDVKFGTCLYSEETGYQGVMKLIAQSGDNGMLAEYIHVSTKSFSRETIRPGIISLSQYEDDESKMAIETEVYDKLLKIMNLYFTTIQTLVNHALTEAQKTR